MYGSGFVGRVGGLAVALGVGLWVTGGGVANAAPQDSSQPSAGAESPSQARSGASRSPRQAPTADRRARKKDAAPRAAAIPRRDFKPAASSAATEPEPAPESLPEPPRPLADPPAVSTVVAPAAAQARAATSAAAQAFLVKTVVAVRAQAPVMTVPASSAAVDPVPAPWVNTGSGGTVDSPVPWAVLAAARRQTLPAAVIGNRAPVISGVSLSAPNPSTGAVTGTVVASDPEGGRMTLSATTTAKGTVVIGKGGVFIYTPTAAARHAAAKVGATTAKTDTVTVTVTDARRAAAVKTVTVPILASNAVPVATKTVGAPNSSTGVVTGSVTATDADKDVLTYGAPATTAKGAVSINAGTGAFTYTPTAAARHAAAKIGATAEAKTDTVTVTVTDGYGGSVAVPVTMSIAPRNAAPVAGTTTVGTPNATTGVVTGTVTATDPDKDTLTYTAPATTSKGAVSINAGTGAFTFTPAAAAHTTVTGSDSFTVTVTDGYGGSTPVSVSVPVAPKAAVPSKVSVVFNYRAGATYWSAEAKKALQDSADALAAYFVVTAPVTLVFDVTAVKRPFSSTLASTGSDLISDGKGFFNTVVQNKVLTGVDSNGAEADGSIDVNFGNPWAYGDSVTSSQYDFKSTMTHEMLHAYGFLAYVDEAGWNSGTTWTKFDSFIMTNTRTKVINAGTHQFNSAYNTNLTGGGGGLFFGGPNAVAAYGGLVPLYTPRPWESGSSVSHLDDFTFTGSNAQLMNALADTGRSPRKLSAIELGILKDIGYTVNTSLLFFGVVFLRKRKPQA